MLNRILLVTIAFLCNTKLAEAIDTGKGATFDVSYLTDKNLL